MKKYKHYILFFIAYATMFFFGFVDNIKGVAFPLIKMEFGASYESQGGLVSFTWFGYVIFCFIASIFLQKFGIKKSVLAGYILVCLGAIATLAAPSFWAATLTIVIINTGFGFFEVGANALGTALFKKKAALLMNLMHFFYGFGAILGPKASGLLTGTFNFSWKELYLVIIIPGILIAIFIVFTRFNTDSNNKTVNEENKKPSFITILKNPMVWIFSITIGFMEVVEFGTTNWGALYLQDVYGLDPRTVGATFLSFFYVMFTASRLFSGLIIEKAGYMKSLVLSTVSTMLLFFFGFVLGQKGIWILPITGLFVAILFPTAIAVIMDTFKEDAPIVSSIIITLAGAVNGILQLSIGFINQYIGEAWGYRSCLLYSVILLLLLFYLIRIREKGSMLKVEN